MPNPEFNFSRNTEYVLLISLTFIVLLIKIPWAFQIPGPRVFFDETYYLENARALFHFAFYPRVKYPPFYSLTIFPAFFFRNWYECIALVNVLWSSLLIPATWLLGRSAGLRNPLAASVLASVLPMHAIYPHLVLSENVFVTLFVLSVALALRGGNQSFCEAAVFGFSMAIAHLTKYLYLPAVPLLYAAWILAGCRNRNEPFSNLSFRQITFLASPAVSYLLIMGCWIMYAHISGASLGRMFGFGISGVTELDINISSLASESPATTNFTLSWSLLYVAYIISAWFPAWIPIFLWIAHIRGNLFRQRWKAPNVLFLILTWLCLSGYWAVAVRHSLSAEYNYPVPSYILGRYLMHVIPLILVASIMALENLTARSDRISIIRTVFSTAIIFLSFLASWWVLFRDGFIEVSPYFARIRFNAVGLSTIDSAFALLGSCAVAVVVAITLRISRKGFRIVSLFITILFLFHTLMNAKEMAESPDPRHSREISSIWHLLPEHKPIRMVLDSPLISDYTLSNGLEFYNISKDSFVIHSMSPAQTKEFILTKDEFLLISPRIFGFSELHSYSVGKTLYRVYWIEKPFNKEANQN